MKTKEYENIRPLGRTTTLLAALALFGAGCGTPPRPRTPAKPAPVAATAATLILGENVSGGFAPFIDRATAFVIDAVSSLAESAFLDVERFDSTCENVWDGQKPADEEDFSGTVTSRLRANPKKRGTLTCLFVVKAEAVAEKAPGPVSIGMVGDAYSENMPAAGHAATKAAAAKLAANHNFRKFFVVGAEPEARKEIRDDFAALGGNLVFLEYSDDPAVMAGSLDAEDAP